MKIKIVPHNEREIHSQVCQVALNETLHFRNLKEFPLFDILTQNIKLNWIKWISTKSTQLSAYIIISYNTHLAATWGFLSTSKSSPIYFLDPLILPMGICWGWEMDPAFEPREAQSTFVFLFPSEMQVSVLWKKTFFTLYLGFAILETGFFFLWFIHKLWFPFLRSSGECPATRSFRGHKKQGSEHHSSGLTQSPTHCHIFLVARQQYWGKSSRVGLICSLHRSINFYCFLHRLLYVQLYKTTK